MQEYNQNSYFLKLWKSITHFLCEKSNADRGNVLYNFFNEECTDTDINLVK